MTDAAQKSKVKLLSRATRAVTAPATKGKNASEMVVVIGAAGLVGSRLSKALCDLDIPVIGLDNDVDSQAAHLADLQGEALFELIEADVLEGVPTALLGKPITNIIYAADVMPHIGETQQSLNRLLDNSVGLKNVLEFANKIHARVVYTSSIDIYHGLASHEQLHNYYDGKDLSAYFSYLEGKRYGEALCREYSERFGLDIRIARFSEIYGPGMDLGSRTTLTQAIGLALKGKDLIMHEVGSQEHSLLFVDDAVYGLIKLLLSTAEQAKGGIFYFVNPEKVSTLSIAYTVKEVLQRDLDVEFIPHPQSIDFPGSTDIDITRSERLLSWSPKISLTEGLERTLRWFLAQMGQDLEPKKIRYEKSDTPVSAPPVPIEKTTVSKSKESKIMPTLPSKIDSTTRILPKMEVSPAPEPKKVKKNYASKWADLGNGKSTPSIAIPPVFNQLKQRTSGLSMPTVPKLPKLRLRGAAVLIVVFLLILIIPPLLLFGFASRALAATRDLDFDTAEKYYNYAETMLSAAEPVLTKIGLGDETHTYLSGLRAGNYAVRSFKDLEGAAGAMSGVLGELAGSFGRKDGADPQETGTELAEAQQMVGVAVANTRSAQTNFALLKKEVDAIHPEFLPARYRSDVIDAKSLVWLLDPAMQHSEQLLPYLPELLGFKNQRRYVVMLQNNNEIRATGGFIGSYVAFNINKGRFNQFKVDDIYNPDGLLEPHKNPAQPEAMEKYLDIDYLGARDSSWWPDFPTSAQVFKTLYERATKERLDGVIGVNLSIVQHMLEQTGPVFVEAYKEEITAENVFDRAQLHSEVGFKPGSTQKRDFLSALTDAVFAKLASMGPDASKGLGEVFLKGMASRDIMIYSNEPHIQEAFASAQLAGQLIPSTGDYLKVVDSNVGGNKANFWVDRHTKYEVSVDRDGSLQGKATLTWKHRGENSTWPNGDYKNYLRVYLPLGVTDIRVDPAIPDQTIYPSFERTVVEGLVEVPITTTREVVISYKLPKIAGFGDKDTYSLVWENQAGMAGETIDFDFHLPSFLQSQSVTQISKPLKWPNEFNVTVTGTEAIQRAPTPKK